MAQGRTQVNIPQPLRVRLEEAPSPVLLSWRAALKRHRGMAVLMLLFVLLVFISGVVAYMLTALRMREAVTLQQGACHAQGWVDYPRYAAVGAPARVRLTLQASSYCPFSGRVTLIPHPRRGGADSLPEALTPLVWEVNLPAGGMTTLDASLRPTSTGDLSWEVGVPGQPFQAMRVITFTWGRWADFLRRLAWALLSLGFLPPVSALLGLWPRFRGWINRLRMP